MAFRPPKLPPLPRPPQGLSYDSGGAFPPGEALRLDPEAFDIAIRSQGLQFVHWLALKCPAGSVDADDERHPHGDHAGCSNGFIYRLAGLVSAVVGGNHSDDHPLDMGIVHQATLQLTLPRSYDDNHERECLVAPYDRLYLADPAIVVPNWERLESTGTDVETCSYPLESVQALVDSRLLDYHLGQEFDLEEGRLRWRPGATRPHRDPGSGHQGVFTIRYMYRPYWYVASIPHEIRATQVEDPLSGEVRTARLPQAIVAQREYVFESEPHDDAAVAKVKTPLAQALGETSLRRAIAPRQGLLGPR